VGLPKNKKWDGITKKQLKYKIFRWDRAVNK
jgi:hypothetical protein